MKTEILQIADDLRNGEIDAKTAKIFLLHLFSVSRRFLVTHSYINKTDVTFH